MKKKSQFIKIYILRAAKINMSQLWKEGILPTISDWETKTGVHE